MIVVSDTSCISNLYQIGQLRLLTKLFREIFIPPSVFNELAIFHTDNLLKELGSFNIEIHNVNNNNLKNQIAANGIDAGEVEAIALSIELKPDFLVIDEKEGKKVALKYGINTIGIPGVILLAKEKKLVDCVKPLFDSLRNNTKFYFSNSLYLFLIKAAGENTNT